MSGTTIRQAAGSDQQALTRLLNQNRHHHHLDWRNPVNLIGSMPFLVLEREGNLSGTLACPPDPPGVAWLRLFVVQEGENTSGVWKLLWETASRMLAGQTLVAAICLSDWFEALLVSSGFYSRQKLVLLEKFGLGIDQRSGQSSARIRPMQTKEYGSVIEVDAAAFPLLWQITLPDLQRAHTQSFLATVAEMQSRVVGYQVSTRSTLGIHLARLAVHPDFQGKGIAWDLVKDLISQAGRQNLQRFTVNTQSDNPVSLMLYKKMGFQETGERYPVYNYQIPLSG
jgi:ribosomal protein S18 acetylase RimI-like enzyme